MTKQKCMMRGGCSNEAQFEVLLEASGRTVYRCEEHVKRKYFLSNDVSIKRMDDSGDEFSPPIDMHVTAVSIEQFGRDHASLLGYIGTRALNYDSILDAMHLRVHPSRHPEYYAGNMLHHQWDERQNTRLRGFNFSDWKDKANEGKVLSDHDDIDCLIDLENAGYLEWKQKEGLQINLTLLGSKTADAIIKHRDGEGKPFSTFDWSVTR